MTCIAAPCANSSVWPSTQRTAPAAPYTCVVGSCDLCFRPGNVSLLPREHNGCLRSWRWGLDPECSGYNIVRLYNDTAQSIHLESLLFVQAATLQSHSPQLDMRIEGQGRSASQRMVGSSLALRGSTGSGVQNGQQIAPQRHGWGVALTRSLCHGRLAVAYLAPPRA